jgi:hypothetical protein
MWQKNRVFPVWAVALVVAAAAPLAVRWIGDRIEKRARERTAPIAAALTKGRKRKTRAEVGEKRDASSHEGEREDA